jgi:hypothetical protein
MMISKRNFDSQLDYWLTLYQLVREGRSGPVE